MSTIAQEAIDPATMRLQLIGAGWRSLTTATDPRKGSAGEGSEITIGYWPSFTALGVGSMMVKAGRQADVPGASYMEIYRRGKHSWIPV